MPTRKRTKQTESPQSVYLDTTILSYLHDERKSLKTYVDVTQNWWQTQRKYYQLFLSQETVIELQAGRYPHKNESLATAGEIEILQSSDYIADVAEIYIKNFIMPKNIEGDAVHLAYASVYKVDYLLTWNCKHLANANKKQHIRQLNTKLGLYVPEIITPLELFME